MDTGIIWEIPKEQLAEIVSKATSIAEILRKIGYVEAGASYKTIRKRMTVDGIDFSHIPQGLGSNKFRHFHNKNKIPLSDVLIDGSHYNRQGLKKRLIKEGLLKNECSICGMQPSWNGKPLVMVIDHINGKNNDNRIENLRLLCPNCNSQQDTFCGKNIKSKPKKYCKCGKQISRKAENCQICAGKIIYAAEIASRPPKEVLISEVEENGWTQTGEKYGVNGNTIKKWLKAYGFQFQNRVTPKQRRTSFPKVCKSKTGHMGVRWHKRNKRWEASISFNKKRIYIGSFGSVEEAGNAYVAKRNEIYGLVCPGEVASTISQLKAGEPTVS